MASSLYAIRSMERRVLLAGADSRSLAPHSLRERDLARCSQRLTMCDPLRGQLFLRRVLRQARIERSKIDLVDRLVLVEAGKDIAQLAADRIAMRLQALRADFLHHALHRRVDRCNTAMRSLEVGL